MSPLGETPPDVGAARLLAEALRAALSPGASAESFAVARAAVQITGLDGLDACLRALEPHREAPWPAPLAALADRVLRITDAGRLQGFRDADRELGAHAAEVLGMSWERSPASPSTATVTVAEALDELPIGGAGARELAQRMRLAVPVAAALRAALEWLTREIPKPRPFVLRGEDSVLEVVCEAIHPEGLAPAHETLSAAGGNLSPISESSGRASGGWLVRVPAWSERPLHLMFEQGSLRLAAPWHAVLRMSLVPAIELELRRDRLSTPILAPLAPLLGGIAERPVLAIGHGVKSALLVADRLVWRLAAEPCEAPATSPDPRLAHAVRSEEGDVFWVVEPRLMLEAVPMPALPAAPKVETPAPASTAPQPPAMAKSEPAAPTATPPTAKSEPAPQPIRRPFRPRRTAPIPTVLKAADVDPIVLGAADVEPLMTAAKPAPAPEPAAQLAPASEPAPRLAPAPEPATRSASTATAAPPPEWPVRLGTPGFPPPGIAAGERATARVARTDALAGRPVLIAEGSLAGRHFLARLLEREGFEAQAVPTASELCRALAARRWMLVAVDVELPDAHGLTWLTELRGELERAEVPFVALVRDDRGADLARAAGIRRWLRKPFDRDELTYLLRAWRLIPGASA